MTYNPDFDWAVLSGGTMTLRDEEFEPWRSIIESVEGYPSGKYHPPLKAPKGREKPRIIAGVVFEFDGPEVLVSNLTAIAIALNGVTHRVEVSTDADESAARLLGVLLLPDFQRAMLAAWRPSEGAFHRFLRQLARPLVRLGVTIEPVASGTKCKALILRYKRRSWWFTDATEMVGGSAIQEASFIAEYAPRSAAPSGSPARLAEALQGFQRQLESMFGVALHATIGAAALRAAQGYIGAQKHVWRASPLMVAMLRGAHGFRGGYAYAQRYDGPAWRLDMNKAYTAALATPLPLRAALVPASARFDGKPGVYLCRILGPGLMPLYVAPWDPLSRAFKPDYWNGSKCLAILEESEMDGVRAMGFEVQQLGGFAYVRDWTLEPFSRRIAELCAQHGRGSAHERTAKIIGNSVYGKFAEKPEREQVMYSLKRPGPDWHPMIDLHGEELPDLWTMAVVSHRPGQHIDVASCITGRVRGWLYEAMGIAVRVGGAVVHADTDGILSTVNIEQYLVTNAAQPGSWRVDPEPQRAIVWGRKGYAFGDDVKAAGFAGLDTDDAAYINGGGAVETVYTNTPAPWKSGAGARRASRTARATA